MIYYKMLSQTIMEAEKSHICYFKLKTQENK